MILLKLLVPHIPKDKKNKEMNFERIMKRTGVPTEDSIQDFPCCPVLLRTKRLERPKSNRPDR